MIEGSHSSTLLPPSPPPLSLSLSLSCSHSFFSRSISLCLRLSLWCSTKAEDDEMRRHEMTWHESTALHWSDGDVDRIESITIETNQIKSSQVKLSRIKSNRIKSNLFRTRKVSLFRSCTIGYLIHPLLPTVSRATALHCTALSVHNFHKTWNSIIYYC